MGDAVSNVLNAQYTPEEKLMRGRIQLNRNHPFFGYLVAYMKFRDLSKEPYPVHINTLAVTSGTTVMYNPLYIDSIKDNDVIFGILVHEVMHLALRHNIRQGSRDIVLIFKEEITIPPDPAKGEKVPTKKVVPVPVSLYNIASDIVINNIIVKNSIKLPEEGLIPRDDKIICFGTEITDIENKSAEEIYDILARSLEKQAKNDNKKGSSSVTLMNMPPSGSESQGDSPYEKGSPSTTYEVKDPKSPKPYDKHLWGEKEGQGKGNKKDNSDGKGEGQQSEGGSSLEDMGDIDWDKVLAEAKEHAVHRGTIPAGMTREFQVVKTKRLSVDGFLRKIIGESIPMDYTWKKPNKNLMYQGYYLPATYGEKIKILFSIDTSGSVTQDDLSKYMSIITNITKSHELSVEFRLLTHDADVHDDYHMYNGNMDKLKQVKIHGGGGTSHRPLFDYIYQKKYHHDTKLLISFTDGYSDYPENVPRGFKVVFVLAGHHCGIDAMPKWATTITYSH